jgi:ubiquinone/menaquinone biosynthesis C-methylase UbiE
MPNSDAPVDSTAYSEEYFLTECDGYSEYLAGAGGLSARLRALCRFLRVQPGMKVLDVGCGRGEVILECVDSRAQAIGIDYSEAALRLVQQAISHTKQRDRDTQQHLHLSLSNAKQLPFPDNTFDRAIMSDLVEHLYPKELESALKEVHRVLIPKGELLIHTMPNLWYYRVGYPLFRLVEKLRGVSLPADPRERFQFSHLHVNEQTPRSLRRTLRDTGFSHWRVWLYDYRDYPERQGLMRFSMQLLTSLPLAKQVFCDDIFALARK